jgi:hypothetical protein
MFSNALKSGSARKLAAAGILALGAGTYPLMASTFRCGSSTISLCPGECYSQGLGGYKNACSVTDGPTECCTCDFGNACFN